MKLRVKCLMSFILFVGLIFSGCFGLLAEKVPQEVLQAAQKGMKDLPLGVSAAASLDNPQLNHGFQVYTAAPVSLLGSAGLSSSLSPTGQWRLVMVNEGRPVSLITIAQVRDRWQAVAIGGAQLAVEMNKVMEQWPEAEGYSHRFIRVYQARADMVEISRGSSIIGFVPLTASRVAFGMKGEFDPAVLLHDSQIIPPLRQAAVEALNNLEEK